jgi:hypothetical protein
MQNFDEQSIRGHIEGAWEEYLRKAHEDAARTPEPQFDDSWFRNFVKRVEIDKAIAELPPSDGRAAARPRLRSERRETEGEDFFKSAGGTRDSRRRAVLRAFLKHEPNEDGELPESVTEAMRALLTETA